MFLKNAPHSMNDLINRKHPYSPEKGVYPLQILKDIKQSYQLIE